MGTASCGDTALAHSDSSLLRRILCQKVRNPSNPLSEYRLCADPAGHPFN